MKVLENQGISHRARRGHRVEKKIPFDLPREPPGTNQKMTSLGFCGGNPIFEEGRLEND
jgi:hypothetical protein